jgi:hypothetical protein
VEEKVQPTAFFFFFWRGERRFENEEKKKKKALEGLSKHNWESGHQRDDIVTTKKNNAEEFGFYLTTRDHIARS